MRAFISRIIIFGLLPLLLTQCRQKDRYVQISGLAQGGTYYVTYQFNEEKDYQKGIDSIFAAIDNSVSSYNPYSTVSRINNNENMTVDPILQDLFNRSREIYEETNHLFDVTAAPIFDFWGFGSADDTLFLKMTESQIQDTLTRIHQYTGMDKFYIADGKMYKPDSRAKLNFNAIAQGYTCDLVARYLDSKGIENYLIEVGGEIYCKGKNRHGQDWNVGIDKPIEGNMISGQNIQDIIQVSDKGIVSSGNYRKFIYKDGKRYSHSINPITGRPVSNNLLSATVITDNAAKADAYATYFMLIGLDSSIQILDARNDLEGYLIYEDDSKESKMNIHFSKGLKIITKVSDRK